jgi:hypothetical protein
MIHYANETLVICDECHIRVVLNADGRDGDRTSSSRPDAPLREARQTDGGRATTGEMARRGPQEA